MIINFNTIKPSAVPPLQCGHLVYDTYFHPSGTTEARHVFYKENKYGKPINSNWEVAFSGLAKLFLKPGLTSNQYVVQKDEEISGVASEDIVYSISQNLDLSETHFFSLDCGKSLQFKAQHVNKPEDIPIYFFNQLPSNVFSKLHQLMKDGMLTFNMESLASVLTTAYALEDDDLNKGNLGFYLLENHGKIEVVFIKIDHDLMLSDSIMSRGSARFANWLYADHAYTVSPRDLLQFPNLKDSGNHYWPTRGPLLARHPGRALFTRAERKMIAALWTDYEFQQAKWRLFLKYIVLPPLQIKEAAADGFDDKTPEGQAYTALVTNAGVARLARLRTALFFLPEFRHFVATITPDMEEQLINEIVPQNAVDSNNRQTLIRQSITDYRNLCQSESFASGDTPLHIAIRLGNYRYDESWHDYGHDANTANHRGQTPLDVAIAQYTHRQSNGLTNRDDNQNPVFIIYDLIQRGARKTAAFREIQDQLEQEVTTCWGEYYREKSRLAHSNETLLTIFRELGADCRLTLKMKKELAVQCVQEHINTSKAHRDYSLEDRLKGLKVALNGDDKHKPDPSLQFIRQLRSRLWIVRHFRGLFGSSSTQSQLNSFLDKELKQFSPAYYTSAFFKAGKTEEPANEGYDPLKVAKVDGEFDAKACDHTGVFF